MAKQTEQESAAEIWRLFKETDTKFKEMQVELDKRFKATDQKINQLSGLFGSQWGKFIEVLVQPNALNLFRQRNVQVNHSFPRAKSHLNGRSMEIDLLKTATR